MSATCAAPGPPTPDAIEGFLAFTRTPTPTHPQVREEEIDEDNRARVEARKAAMMTERASKFADVQVGSGGIGWVGGGWASMRGVCRGCS